MPGDVDNRPEQGAPEGARVERWRWRAPCGDEIERAGEHLVITAALPIDGLELSRFRNPVLRVRGVRFVLTAVEGSAERPVYRFSVEHENLYAPAGDLVIYDGERHEERTRERGRTALAWLLYVPLVPLTPLIGLLPQPLKERMVALGVDPARASRASLSLEWLLLLFGLLGYFFSGGFLTPGGAILGLLDLVLALDIAYRVASDFDGQAPGMFGVLKALRAWIGGVWRTARGRDRLLPDPPVHTPQETPPVEEKP